MTNSPHAQNSFVCSGRIHIVPVDPVQDNGILIQYPIEKAAWIWHPELDRITEAFVCFKIEFELDADTETIIHVSADQRYELYIDGTLVSRGPDRSDLGHWCFASLPVRFKKGKHVITSEVYWIGDMAPEAQITYRPGFIFSAENMDGMLDSGNGEWLVVRREGISLSPGLEDTYHVVGPAFTVDGVEYTKPLQFVKPEIVARQTNSPGGVFSTERILHPTSLPEQRHSWFSGGRIVAVNTTAESQVEFGKTDLDVDDQYDFLNGPVTIPPGSSVNILWDMNEYYCGYAHLRLEGGKGSTVHIEWAESLFVKEKTTGRNKAKGNRNEIAGKYFWGFGDTYLPSGGRDYYKSFWWRAGRYALVRVKTADSPLTIENIKLETTNYPLDFESKFHCPDKDFNRFAPLAERVLRMCGHETFMDCPYYEQLMYVGDSRLELLVWYMGSGDSRLPKRCIELFDWSRWKTGFIGERYPSRSYQLSLTFSMIWVYMLHDFMMWRDDEAWLKLRLTGMRCLLENFYGLPRVDGLLGKLPGWSFIDWAWADGCAPATENGVSSIVNLQYMLALYKAAQLETAIGDALLARRYKTSADELKKRIRDRFWVKEKSLLADDFSRRHFSEHAQCLALLGSVIPEKNMPHCVEAMITEPDIAKTTIYFSFYLFEIFKHLNRGDLLAERLDLWKQLHRQGLKTTVETPEPSRSDCHAWGAHPVFHIHASIAGIRPLEPGFKKIEVKPLPGTFESLSGKMVHPGGYIEYDLNLAGEKDFGTISLPNNTSGVFIWRGHKIKLESGLNSLAQVESPAQENINDPNLKLLEGPALIDHDEKYFDAVAVHPNDAGFKMMAKRLACIPFHLDRRTRMP